MAETYHSLVLLGDAGAFGTLLAQMSLAGATETAELRLPVAYPCMAAARVADGVPHVSYVYESDARRLVGLAEAGRAAALSGQDEFNRQTAAALYALAEVVIGAGLVSPDSYADAVLRGVSVTDQVSAADRDRGAGRSGS